MMTAKKRILIVDDDVSSARLLKLNLHCSGRYTAEVVNDPTNAVAVAREFSPDVILLDVMMPGMDGGQLVSHLRAVAKLEHTPIVFLSAAVTRNEVASRSGCIGGLPFVAKPAHLAEVIKCLEKSLRN